MAITLKNRQQIEKMRDAGRLVAETLQMIGEHVQPGVTTGELDRIVEEYLRGHGAVPSFKGYRGFPASICASVNEVICHGIPGPRRLEEGDIIGIDIGAILDGWHGDSCVSFPVGAVSERAQRLLEVTRRCMELGMAACGPMKRIGDIGAAIQEHAESNGFAVVREYTGHGIGRKMHEDGPTILHYGKQGSGLVMRPGLVFTIEPMINAGRAETKLLKDGWTVVTADGSLSAQFEHTVAITEDGYEILSQR